MMLEQVAKRPRRCCRLDEEVVAMRCFDGTTKSWDPPSGSAGVMFAWLGKNDSAFVKPLPPHCLIRASSAVLPILVLTDFKLRRQGPYIPSCFLIVLPDRSFHDDNRLRLQTLRGAERPPCRLKPVPAMFLSRAMLGFPARWRQYDRAICALAPALSAASGQHHSWHQYRAPTAAS